MEKTGKSRSIKKFGYTQDTALLFRPTCCPPLVHLRLPWLLHLYTPFPWCKILYIYCSFCCFLKFASMNIFASVNCFFNPLNSLNRVRYAPVLRIIVRRGIYINKIVWLQYFCAIPRKKNLDIVRNFAKSCQLTIFWLFAYGAVLLIESWFRSDSYRDHFSVTCL